MRTVLLRLIERPEEPFRRDLCFSRLFDSGPQPFRQIVNPNRTGFRISIAQRDRRPFGQFGLNRPDREKILIFQRFTMPRIALTPTHQGGIAWSALLKHYLLQDMLKRFISAGHSDLLLPQP